jgi:surface protein
MDALMNGRKRTNLYGLRQALRNTSGAIDLASIMVGVLVIGIIGGVIASTVFAVIPWSQNEAAKSTLGSIRTAETVAFAHIKDDAVKGFQTFPELVDSKLIQSSDAVRVATNVSRDCYIAIARSATGAFFYSTSDGPDVSSYVIGSTSVPGCDVTTKGTDGNVGGPGSTPSRTVTDDLATGLLPTTGGTLPSSSGAGGTSADLTSNGAPHTTAARMVSTWDTSIVNKMTSGFQGLSTTCTKIVLPLSGAMNATINWGDGTTSPATELASHQYTGTPGPQTITINGTFEVWGDYDFNWSALCITGVPVWGETQTNWMDNAFNRAPNIGVVQEIPSTVESMAYAFASNPAFNSPVKFFTGNVKDMSGLFAYDSAFNQPVSLNTNSVTKLSSMFESASVFNSPLSLTSTKNATSLSGMFLNASKFNQPVNFDTGNVTSMRSMFGNAPAFNQPVNFDTKNVTNMDYMFYNAVTFNQPLNFSIAKNPSRVGMFYGAYAFNQDISGWH